MQWVENYVFAEIDVLSKMSKSRPMTPLSGSFISANGKIVIFFVFEDNKALHFCGLGKNRCFFILLLWKVGRGRGKKDRRNERKKEQQAENEGERPFFI